MLAEVGESFLNFQVVATREAEQRAELAAVADVVATIPYCRPDITDLAGSARAGLMALAIALALRRRARPLQGWSSDHPLGSDNVSVRLVPMWRRSSATIALPSIRRSSSERSSASEPCSFASGVDGMSLSPLTSSIVAGGVFVMGLVVAGTLSDYKDADRAPSDLATELYAILRECESMNAAWGKPDMALLRQRLIAVVTTLRADIDAGNTRECQQAIEDLSESFLELENTDVPANYIVRLRQSQSGLRKAILRVYHIQREEFLPSAFAMIVSLVVIILAVVTFTDFGGVAQSLVTVGFLSFFFVYLLRLLRVIDKPFKVGRERTDDDVSLFLLVEFVVHADAGERASPPTTSRRRPRR